MRREAIPVSLDEIDQRFVLFYTGAPRQSGINNWEVFKQHIDGEQARHRKLRGDLAHCPGHAPRTGAKSNGTTWSA